jgi:PAS domain S-box-containing protein
MASIESSLKASSRKMWLSALILAMAITGVIVIFMRRLVLRRLHSLVKVVDSIESGESNKLVNGHEGDEIHTLGRHLERMTERLDKSICSLRQREAFLDAVINSADDGIVVVDDQLRIVKANRSFEAMLGVPSSDLVGTRCDCTRLCTGQDARTCPARLTFQSGLGERQIRSASNGNGEVRYYEVFDAPLRHVAGRRQVLEVWHDITQRREIEAHLLHSERLASLGLLASGISHEINNPLASITTCLDGLRRRLRLGGGKRLPEELPEYLELIRGEVGRCRDLTERLKVLGRKPREVRQPVDLHAVVHDIVALMRYEAQKNRVRIEQDLPSGLEPLLADESQLSQVLLNLVLNAIQAIDGSGWVRISARLLSQDQVEIEVVDSGRGIEPEDLSRIFEPFFSARSDGRGTGLGLFIAKIVIEQLGGSIDVSSTPGEGTQFRILLPSMSQSKEEVGT